VGVFWFGQWGKFWVLTPAVATRTVEAEKNMKKLMTALAVCAVAGFALATGGGVVSANIVGYMNKTAPGTYISTGPMFISVGSTNKTWRLGDISATGMDPTSDNIQFLSAADANVVLTATYVDAAHAITYSMTQGWWNLDLDTSLDNTTVASGTGFLTSFASVGITLTYAGEVLQSTNTIDLSGMNYPMIANPTPVDLVLSNITCSGMDPTSDNIQFLSPTDANVVLTATYVDAAHAITYSMTEGWWNLDLDTSLNSTPLPAGAAFLGSISSPHVSITFPNPMH